MYQVSFRRLLAYSSLTHVGYMVLGISLNTIEGFVSAFFYLFIYIVLLIFTFIFLFCFVEKHSTKEIFYIDDISAFGIIAKKHYSVAFLFSTILLSMGGVPFFAGFYSKFYFFMALYSSFNFNLLFALLFVSVVSSIYYIRIIRFLLFTDDFNCNSNLNFLNLNFYNLMFIILIVFFIFNCVIFFFHDVLYLYIQHVILVSFLNA
jgi:NADH:ubiquinone oxidoreductase subunit 2 (subunit N)